MYKNSYLWFLYAGGDSEGGSYSHLVQRFQLYLGDQNSALDELSAEECSPRHIGGRRLQK